MMLKAQIEILEKIIKEQEKIIDTIIKHEESAERRNMIAYIQGKIDAFSIAKIIISKEEEA